MTALSPARLEHPHSIGCTDLPSNSTCLHPVLTTPQALIKQQQCPVLNRTVHSVSIILMSGCAALEQANGSHGRMFHVYRTGTHVWSVKVQDITAGAGVAIRQCHCLMMAVCLAKRRLATLLAGMG